MAKNKKKALHFYSDKENEWLGKHTYLNRTELANKFNKEFKTNQSKLALDKRRRRLMASTNTPNRVPGKTVERLSLTSQPRQTFETLLDKKNSGKKKYLLSHEDVIGSLMEKYVGQTGTEKDKFLVWAVKYISDLPEKEFGGLYKMKEKKKKKKK